MEFCGEVDDRSFSCGHIELLIAFLSESVGQLELQYTGTFTSGSENSPEIGQQCAVVFSA